MDADFNKKIQEIMANPEFQALVRELRGGEDMPDSSEIREKLPEVMATFGPVLAGITGGANKTSETEPERNVKEEKSGISEKTFSGDAGNRNRLLSALKPYLSPERGLLIDRALSAMQFGEMLGGGKNERNGEDK